MLCRVNKYRKRQEIRLILFFKLVPFSRVERPNLLVFGTFEFPRVQFGIYNFFWRVFLNK